MSDYSIKPKNHGDKPDPNYIPPPSISFKGVPLTDEAIATELHKIDVSEDTEMAHIYADNLFCDILSALGFNKAVEVFVQMDKWYA